jgi:hypothetical protein
VPATLFMLPALFSLLVRNVTLEEDDPFAAPSHA